MSEKSYNRDVIKPEDIKDHVDTNKGMDGDSIQFVTVPGEDKVFLYLWDTETNSPVASVVGFDETGVEMLQDWLTNVDIEAWENPRSNYGDSDE